MFGFMLLSTFTGLGKISCTNIEIKLETLLKLFGYVDAARGEIGGLGEAVLSGKSLRIKNVYLLPQTAFDAGFFIDATQIAKFLERLDKEGKKIAINLWWHSHGFTSLFWSKDDEDTIESFGKQAPWWISLLLNKEGEIKVRLDIFSPFRLVIDNLPIRVIVSRNFLKEEWYQEVREMVKERRDKQWKNSLDKGESLTLKNSDFKLR